MKHLLLFISLSFIGITLQAQLSVYDISNYKARYERRPSFFTNIQGNYSSNFQSDDYARHAGSYTIPLNWWLRSNTDAMYSEWRISSALTGGFNRTQSNDKHHLYSRVRFNVDRLVRLYKPSGKFWGWSLNMASQSRYQAQDERQYSLDVSFDPAIFRGSGRIEYAEDALLAKWMLEDLMTEGVIEEYQNSDIEALARTITEIIGDRTFDTRRRETYRLKRLQETIFAQGLVDEESFELFAILTDNWRFANRSTLEHGRSITYGFKTFNDFDFADGKDVIKTQRLNSRFQVFGDFQKSKIIRDQINTTWTSGVAFSYYLNGIRYNSQQWGFNQDGWHNRMYIGYGVKWLPSSRTELKLNNRLQWDSFSEEPTQVFSLSENRASLSLLTELAGEYFINYRWSLNPSIKMVAEFSNNEGEQQFSLSPQFGFKSLYYFQ